MDDAVFKSLYKDPIYKLTEIIQNLPASEMHHHSYLGGLLDHILEVTSIAAQLRQNYLLPVNAAPEDQAKQSEAWTATVIYGALLHDIGKIVTDMQIETSSYNSWLPWHGSMVELHYSSFRFKHIKNRDYKLHPTLGSFFALKILPTVALDWLTGYPEAYHALLYLLAGHYDKAGILGEIIQKSDQISVAHNLGGDISKIKQRPKTSFPQQIIMALRYLLEHDLKLNTQKGGSDGWLTHDSLWLMSKGVTDQIRAYLLKQGVSVPNQNGKIFDEMQAHGILQPTEQNKAIWHCHIKSSSGWAPENSFTLLRINPSVIWDKIDQRPEIFDGFVEVVSEITKKEVEEYKPTNLEDNNLDTIRGSIKQDNSVSKNIREREEDNFDYTINLFSSETEAKKDIKQPYKNSNDYCNNQLDICSSHANELTADDFLEWLIVGIKSHKLVLNRANAKLHIVEDKLFLVSPGIFQMYCQEKSGNSNREVWVELQKKFQKLGIHKKRPPDNFNVWTCIVIGGRKHTEVKGYLIENISIFFDENKYMNNLYLKIKEE